jgi:hypothetical protein
VYSLRQSGDYDHSNLHLGEFLLQLDSVHIKGSISKLATNGSKTALMDAIGSMCITSSSIVHLHDSLGSRSICSCSEARFSRQNGDIS